MSTRKAPKKPAPKLRREDEPVTVKRWQLEHLISDLAGAQHKAVLGALPASYLGGGPTQAVDAYWRIERARVRLGEFLAGVAS